MTILKTYILLMGLGIILSILCFISLTIVTGSLEIWERWREEKARAKQRNYLQTRYWRYDLPGRRKTNLRQLRRKSIISTLKNTITS